MTGGEGPRYFGKYRGTVENNLDPLTLGRVQVSVPAALGSGRLSWAEPCVAYAGSGVGWFAVPPVGANVWVEFEAGDPQRPILAGCFWAPGEVPGTGLPTEKVLATEGVTLTLDDLPGKGGLTLEVGPPVVPAACTITLSSSGIELSIGASTILVSATSVSVNNGALEVV